MKYTSCERVTFERVKPIIAGETYTPTEAYLLERLPLTGGTTANRKILTDGRTIAHFFTTPRRMAIVVMVEGDTFDELRATDDPIMQLSNTYQEMIVYPRDTTSEEDAEFGPEIVFVENITPQKVVSSGDYFTRQYMIDLSLDNLVGEC